MKVEAAVNLSEDSLDRRLPALFVRNSSSTAIMRNTLLLACVAIAGCRPQSKPAPFASNSDPTLSATSAQLRAIVAKGSLSGARTESFADCSDNVQKVYEATGYAPAWLRDGQATPQALLVISTLENSGHKGLNPEDYDASLWPARVATLKGVPADAEASAQFDVALTVGALRYLSNLRDGRLNPKPVSFTLSIDQQHYDLPQFLVQKILTAGDMPAELSIVEPQYLGYKRTMDALKVYQALQAKDHSVPLPDVERSVKSGDAYPGVDQLGQRLRLLGDLPQGDDSSNTSTVYEGPLVEAVKHFQARTGLKQDGLLNKETVAQLNIPLSDRVLQLEDSLERWRWLPSDYPLLPVAVNIPGFILRVFSDDHHVALRMNVVVGKAFQHQTPVFAKEMKYIIFRPYWNLPLDITRAEIVPKVHRDPHYLERKGFEVTDQAGRVIAGSVSAATLARIRSGSLMVRQKPGPSNALGLVKFMFPNEFDVYLHSTPTPQLFKQSRRDFSHGCIRVEKPEELAAFLLQDQPKWSLENIHKAMQSGPDNQQVNLTKPVPVVIVYLTAIVEEDGQVYFYKDIYGRDATLNAALAKGLPYQ
jgi:murein L,D-transpeptidase YcbB/YkuD